MILVDSQIKKAIGDGELGIEYFSEEALQPASYDLRIGKSLYSPLLSEPDKPYDLSKNGGVFRIPPYGNVVLMTHEILKIPPTLLGRIGLKSGFARKGLFASTGPQVDPGFEGSLCISLQNLWPISNLIKYKDTFLTIEFHRLEVAPEKTYCGPYQGQREITPDVLADVLRLEGLNLSQMQGQFTELAEHVKEWSHMASRFDEFLKEMRDHTKAISALIKQPSVGGIEVSPPEAREMSIEEAMGEILDLFRQQGRLFYSDISEALQLDVATVVEACEELQKKGLIEAAENET